MSGSISKCKIELCGAHQPSVSQMNKMTAHHKYILFVKAHSLHHTQ